MKPLLHPNVYPGRAGFYFPPSDYVCIVFLTANTPKDVQPPEHAVYVKYYSAGHDFFARNDGAEAEVPLADITDGGAPEWNPGVRALIPGKSISLAAPMDCKVELSFYGE